MSIFRSIRRNRILKQGLLPPDVWAWLINDHPILAGLSTEELATLRRLSTLFLHEKVFEGAEGLELTDPMCEVISVQACLPVLQLGLEWYDNWKTIVVVPDVFIQEHREFDRAGVAHEWNEDNSGESWDSGPVVLSWKDVEASGWGDGYNVVIHEAAHRLDLLDGEVNGRPALHEGMKPQEWLDVFSAAFADLKRKAAKGQAQIENRLLRDGGRHGVLSPSPASTSSSNPGSCSGEYPEVYRLLRDFYSRTPG